MAIVDNNLDSWKRRTGNVFKAVLQAAAKARELYPPNSSYISDCEALTWALTDKQPDILSDPGRFNKKHYTRSDEDEYLCYVDDEEIREAVKSSYQLSLIYHHLLYDYRRISDPRRMARVRVITNMLWNNSR